MRMGRMEARRCEDVIARLGRRVLLVGGVKRGGMYKHAPPKPSMTSDRRNRRRRGEEHENATREKDTHVQS